MEKDVKKLLFLFFFRNFAPLIVQEELIHITRRDPKLAALVKYVGPIDIRQYDDIFRFIVCEICGQMLSNQVKRVIVGRFLLLCNNQITPNAVLKLSISDLRGIGLSTAKSTYILSFAQNIAEGKINLLELQTLPDDSVTKILVSQKGIGVWTAKMVLLFALQRPNILPYEDVAFLQGYNWLYNKKKATKDEICKRAKKWSPYCSLAARYLYECVNLNLIKQPNNILNDGLE